MYITCLANDPSLTHGTRDDATAQPDTQRRRAGVFSDKVTHAFQLATDQGPLCHEPMQGIAVFIEEVTSTATGDEELSRLTGEVIRSVKEAVWQGFLDWSPRMLLAMYSCEIQASSKLTFSTLVAQQTLTT